jgi:hypothetical protein
MSDDSNYCHDGTIDTLLDEQGGIEFVRWRLHELLLDKWSTIPDDRRTDLTNHGYLNNAMNTEGSPYDLNEDEDVYNFADDDIRDILNYYSISHGIFYSTISLGQLNAWGSALPPVILLNVSLTNINDKDPLKGNHWVVLYRIADFRDCVFLADIQPSSTAHSNNMIRRGIGRRQLNLNPTPKSLGYNIYYPRFEGDCGPDAVRVIMLLYCCWPWRQVAIASSEKVSSAVATSTETTPVKLEKIFSEEAGTEKKMRYLGETLANSKYVRVNAAATSSSSRKDVSNSTAEAINLLSVLQTNSDAEKIDDLRATLARGIDNPQQMASVWGTNIRNWARCERGYVRCPCCFLCGLPILDEVSRQMEHKIPSVPAYLNVPHFNRIGPNFLNKWQEYIKNQPDFFKLTQLYNAINCTEKYDGVGINTMFNNIFNAAELPDGSPNYNYWREILKFWMMEFAYAHATCNSAKSSLFICGDLKSADCTLGKIDGTQYTNFVKRVKPISFKKGVRDRRGRTTNMFTHLNEVLNDVQRLSCVRSGCTYNEDARSAIHILNLRYAQVRRQYEDIQKKINYFKKWLNANIKKKFNSWHATAEAEWRISIEYCNEQIKQLTTQLNQLWISESDIAAELKNEVGNDAAMRPEVVASAAGGEDKFETGIYTGKSAGGEDKTKTSGNDTPPPRIEAQDAEVNNPFVTPTKRNRDDNKEKKDETDSLGGTIKNKRRTQKRITSRRRKITKKLMSRRKRYTRKQKK